MGGVGIKIFSGDHGVPHVHVWEAECRAKMAIRTGQVIAGHLPAKIARKAARYVLDNQDALMAIWNELN